MVYCRHFPEIRYCPYLGISVYSLRTRSPNCVSSAPVITRRKWDNPERHLRSACRERKDPWGSSRFQYAFLTNRCEYVSYPIRLRGPRWRVGIWREPSRASPRKYLRTSDQPWGLSSWADWLFGLVGEFRSTWEVAGKLPNTLHCGADRASYLRKGDDSSRSRRYG